MAVAVILNPPYLVFRRNTSSGSWHGAGAGTACDMKSPCLRVGQTEEGFSSPPGSGFYIDFCVQSSRRLYSGEAGQSSSPGFSFPRLSEHLALLFAGMCPCFWAHPFFLSCWGGEGIGGATGSSFRVHMALVGTTEEIWLYIKQSGWAPWGVPT